MEEVLNSVKQKHREKHKRKREEKRRAAMRAEAAAEAEAETEQPTPATKTKTTTTTAAAAAAATTKNGRHVLREKTTRENGIGHAKRKSNTSPVKSSTPLGADQQTSIMKHFAKAATAPVKPTTNVFELMMNARNRSLGTNANGQATPESPAADAASVPSLGTPRTKRKQLLQEWNERKGGAKRRLAEDARGEYIEQQMEQRAKRLKKMLTQPAETSEQSSQEPQPASAPVKRARGRPRTRRHSADVDAALPAESSSSVCVETVSSELVAKPSSPNKKRDSLLGYFPKLESPKDASETLPLETPKRRPRASKAAVQTPVSVELTTTPSGRPRRSCANKARYDYDLEPSPTKATTKPSPSSSPSPSPSPPPAEESIEIIELDNSNPAITPKKLAPLFMRQLPKPSPDPTTLRARREFLQSGVPDKLRQDQQRQRCFEQYYEDSYEIFPRIAHVGGKPLATGKRPQLRTEKEQDQDQKEEAIVRKCSVGSISSCLADDFALRKQRSKINWTPLPLLDNKRSLVKNWKSVFERFPTFKCYNQMREKYRHFSAIDTAQDTQPMGESFVVTRRTRRSREQQQQLQHGEGDDKDKDKPPALAPNGELLFTEKYKPLLFEQVLVNLTPVQELRDFLSNWNGVNRNSQSQSQSQHDDSSMDFGHDSSSMGASCNTMVLLGPCSSGKTNAVFALANDMNFNVLEINAGMRRTGKKLMQELQEATQSHQIRKEAKAGAAPTQQLLQKLQQNGLKAKQRQQGDEDVRKSLILIEDADIVFENMDAGFTDAIYTLAASSKRPVIIVASDPNCAHLQRLMQQNTIRFLAPNALNISRFLAVLALMENCPIELDDLISLYLYNKQNLRKTLMELQFFIQSGGDGDSLKRLNSPVKSSQLATLDGVHIHQRLYEFYATPQNVQHAIPFPIDFRLLRQNLNEFLRHSLLLRAPSTTAASRRSGKRKSCSPKKAWLSTATHIKAEEALQAPLQTLATFYEHLSTATLLDARLGEHNDRLQPHLGEELAHTLVERAVGTCLAAKDYAYSLFDKPKQRFNLSDQLGSCYLRTSCVRSLDYEPAMRSICRSEKLRAGLERRSSRFYHYLRNYAANGVTSFSSELYDSACQVLQEETDKVPTTVASTELVE